MYAPFPPFPISLMVSVDVKHHVYLLTYFFGCKLFDKNAPQTLLWKIFSLYHLLLACNQT